MPVPANRLVSFGVLVRVTCSSWHSCRGVLTVLCSSLALMTSAPAPAPRYLIPASAPPAVTAIAPKTDPNINDLFTVSSEGDQGRNFSAVIIGTPRPELNRVRLDSSMGDRLGDMSSIADAAFRNEHVGSPAALIQPSRSSRDCAADRRRCLSARRRGMQAVAAGWQIRSAPAARIPGRAER